MKLKIYVSIFLCILLCECVLSPTQGITFQNTDTYEKKAQSAYDRQDYAESESYYSKLLEIHTKTSGANAVETLRARRKIAESMIGNGKYKEANALLEQLKIEQEKALGKEHRETLKTRFILATTLYYLGNPQAMLNALHEIIQVQERALGFSHRDTLETLSTSGTGLFAIGKTKDAKEIWEKVLTLSTKHFGVNDELTLFMQMNLGVATSVLGDPQKALDIYLEIKPKMEKFIGLQHWKTLNLYGNIAIAYRKIGNNEKAQEYDNKINSIQKKTLDENHPLSLIAKGDMARKLYEEGKFQEAKIMLEEVLQQQVKIVGERHRDTLLTAFQLIQNYRQAGELDNAFKLLKKYLIIFKNSLGEEHPLMLEILYEQAALLREMGKLQEAYIVLKKLLSIHEQVYGKEHRDNLDIKEALIILEKELGKTDNVEKQFKEHLALVEKKFGKEHPSTIIAMNNYAISLNEAEKFRDAITIQEAIYEIQKKKLRSKHPDTLTTATVLAALYSKLGDKHTAKKILENTIPLLEQELGKNHTATITAKNNLTILLSNKESLESIKDVYISTKNTLGVNHPLTLTALHNLAASHAQFFDFESARKLLEEGIASASTALGKNSTDVITLRKMLAYVYSSLNMYEASLDIYNDLIEHHSKIYAPESEQIRTLKQSKANVLLEMNNASEANKIKDEINAGKKQNDFDKYNTKSIQELLNEFYSLAKNKNYNEIERNVIEFLSRYVVLNKFNGDLGSRLFLMLSTGALFQQKLYSASFFSKTSVLLEREKRSEIIGLDRHLQQLALGNTQPLYYAAMNNLIRQKRYAEAFSILYFLKEAELDDFSREKILKNYNIDDFLLNVERKLYTKNKEIAEKLYALGQEFIPLNIRLQTLSPAEADKHKKLFMQIENQREKYKNFLLTIEENYTAKSEIKALEKESQTALAVLSKLSQPTNKQEQKVFLEKRDEAIGLTAKVMATADFFMRFPISEYFKIKKTVRLNYLQKQLANFENGIFVHTVLMPDHLVVFLTGQKYFFPYSTKISSSKINDLIMKFRTQIANPSSDPRPVAKELYNIIIKPIRSKIDSLGVKTLIFSLDGNLRYIPMGALFDGKKWLVEDYNICLFNEGVHDFNSTEKKTEKHIAAMGVTAQSQGFSALPSVEYEIDSIVKEGENGIITGKKYLNESFTDTAFAHSLKVGTPLIHIASHFLFAPDAQQNSFLLVGQGEKITMKEMFDVNGLYSFKNVDLLALSACDTASGIKSGDGREIESFGALAQKRGAKAVLATLWSVADASTAAFMQNFYSKYALELLTKEKALAQAQRMFIQGQITPYSTKIASSERGKVIATQTSKVQNVNWAHPFFWAPFILMGGGK